MSLKNFEKRSNTIERIKYNIDLIKSLFNSIKEIFELAILIERQHSGGPIKKLIRPHSRVGRTIEGCKSVTRLYIVDRRGWWYGVKDFPNDKGGTNV